MHSYLILTQEKSFHLEPEKKNWKRGLGFMPVQYVK
jgi:hypothetical protein